jgi:hypothetical protein
MSTRCRYLCTPSHDGTIRVFDLYAGPTQICDVEAPSKSVSAAAWHPWRPLIAACTGGRRFEINLEDGDEEEQSSAGNKRGAGNDGRWGKEEGWGEQKNGVFVWSVNCSQ